MQFRGMHSQACLEEVSTHVGMCLRVLDTAEQLCSCRAALLQDYVLRIAATQTSSIFSLDRATQLAEL